MIKTMRHGWEYGKKYLWGYKLVQTLTQLLIPGPRSTIGSESNCRSRGHEFVFGPAPFIMKYFIRSFSCFHWFKKSYRQKYVHWVLFKFEEEKSVVRLTDNLDLTMDSCWLEMLTKTKQTSTLLILFSPDMALPEQMQRSCASLHRSCKGWALFFMSAICCAKDLTTVIL